MIITPDNRVTVHPPGQIMEYSTLKEAVGGWLGTGAFFHPVGGSTIVMYCDDDYLRKDLPHNKLASSIYNHGWEQYHPVLGTVVFTQSVGDGDSAELEMEDIKTLVNTNAFGIDALKKLEEWDQKEPLTILALPQCEVELVELKEGKMVRSTVLTWQENMIAYHQGMALIRTDHPDYRKAIKEDGRTEFYRKVTERLSS